MDGLEWKRTQYSKPVRGFIRKAEALAAKYADYMVADSIGIQSHILNTYNQSSIYIPYASEPFYNPTSSVLSQFLLQPYSYYLAVSRLEPENNIEMVIQGYLDSKRDCDLVVVGTINSFGSRLKKKYACDKIKFIGPVYNKNVLNNLRYFSGLHFHGHSVGGTNPSLLEAMACQANIAAHDNIFNRAVLEDGGEYFTTNKEITRIIDSRSYLNDEQESKRKNLQKIIETYNWDQVLSAYENLMLTAIGAKAKAVIHPSLHQIA